MGTSDWLEGTGACGTGTLVANARNASADKTTGENQAETGSRESSACSHGTTAGIFRSGTRSSSIARLIFRPAIKRRRSREAMSCCRNRAHLN